MSSCSAIEKHLNSKSRQQRKRETDATPSAWGDGLGMFFKSAKSKRYSANDISPPSLREANQETRSSAAPWEAVNPEELARRLACGRTVNARLLLEQTRLFHFDGADDLPAKSGLPQPCRGLQADYQGERVYILDTYKCRGNLQADVAPIREGREAGKFVLGLSRHARGCDLANLGNGFLITVGAGGRPELHRCSPDAEPSSTGVGPAVAASLAMPRSAGASIAVPEYGKPVVPEGALQHIRVTRTQGYAHKTFPLQRHLGPHFIHDLPLPVRFDARPHRCSHCRNQIRTNFDDDDLPLAEVCHRKVPGMPGAEGSEDDLPVAAFCPRQKIRKVASRDYPAESYWVVSDADIRREFPGRT